MEGGEMRKITVTMEIDPQLFLEDFLDIISAAVYDSHLTRKQIADELDISPSMLTRMLADNPNDTAYFPVIKLPKLIEILKDKTIIYWLCCKFIIGFSGIENEVNSKMKFHEEELLKLIKQIDMYRKG